MYLHFRPLIDRIIWIVSRFENLNLILYLVLKITPWFYTLFYMHLHAIIWIEFYMPEILCIILNSDYM